MTICAETGKAIQAIAVALAEASAAFSRSSLDKFAICFNVVGISQRLANSISVRISKSDRLLYFY